jgi:hypothetical protein
MILRLTALTAASVLLVAGISCDSHSWEETRVLHGHGQHQAKDGHAKEAGHGEKPGAPAAEGAKKEH